MSAPTQVIHVGDIGVLFQVTVLTNLGAPVNLVGGSGFNFRLEHTSGVFIDRIPVFTTNGADGGLQWATTSTADLTLAGSWQLQVLVTVASGTFRSTYAPFTVQPNL